MFHPRRWSRLHAPWRRRVTEAPMATAPAVHSAPFERLRTYASFVRFEHTLFSLPLILAGIFSAPGPTLSVTRWVWRSG